jgi:hypothetical protein
MWWRAQRPSRHAQRCFDTCLTTHVPEAALKLPGASLGLVCKMSLECTCIQSMCSCCGKLQFLQLFCGKLARAVCCVDKAWRTRLGLDAGESGFGGQDGETSAAAASRQQEGVATGRHALEFGADLGFCTSMMDASPDEAALAMCGVAAGEGPSHLGGSVWPPAPSNSDLGFGRGHHAIGCVQAKPVACPEQACSGRRADNGGAARDVDSCRQQRSWGRSMCLRGR